MNVPRFRVGCWRSNQSGYACNGHADGHRAPKCDNIVDETEQKMTGETRCTVCGETIFFHPVDISITTT